MFLINACGSWLRRILQKSMRGSTMSSANFVWPVHFARASTLRKGLPTTLSDLPLWFPFFAIQLQILINHSIPVQQPQARQSQGQEGGLAAAALEIESPEGERGRAHLPNL